MIHYHQAMPAAQMLLKARRRAGLTQRALASRAGVAQPTIARIERGREDPGMRTMHRLLRACGEALETMPVLGEGVERTEIRRLLTMPTAERARSLSADAAFLDRLEQASRSTN